MAMEIDDVVYGKFHLPKDIVAIVETPLFQRLKGIKQLGFLQLDGGREREHTRYHHCIGTYYAADKMLRALEKNTPWLSDNNNNIPLVYRRAVQIAALLHDVGHGPFSHSWERVATDYDHEKIGFFCVDTIFSSIDNKLFPELRDNDNFGIRLIKALIKGKIKPAFKLEVPKKYQFIFGIVSNKRCKLDVDKWDYLKRDYYYLHEICKPDIDFDDVFLQAKVSDCGGHIEYRYEDYGKIYNLFAARWAFHKNCYQSSITVIRDALFQLAINNIQPKINDCPVKDLKPEQNMEAFLEFNDDKLLSLIESDPLHKFLTNNIKFQDSMSTSSVGINILSVSSFVKCDNIDFYGDAEKKPMVTDHTYDIQKEIIFHTIPLTRIP